MRRIINSTYITVDGRVEDPQLWPSTGERDPQFEAIQTDLLLSCDVLVMGRRTYDVLRVVVADPIGRSDGRSVQHDAQVRGVNDRDRADVGEHPGPHR